MTSYIVRTDVGEFYRSYVDGSVKITKVPSQAMLFDYDKAAWLSSVLRRLLDFPQACVCNLRGEVMTYQRLADESYPTKNVRYCCT